MKKLFSTLTLTVCLGAFISCTNDEQEVNMVKPTNANSEIEVINDGTMIKFKDVESYENALLKVSAMSTSEQVSFLNSLSFKSQMILMQEADGELDKICNQAADKAGLMFYMRNININMVMYLCLILSMLLICHLIQGLFM